VNGFRDRLTLTTMADHTKERTLLGTRSPFECIALLLQGGGALGAYQAGVYQGLSEAKIYPDWVAGISIGAVNAAIIAGNSPEARVDKLRAFWEQITSATSWGWWDEWTPQFAKDFWARDAFNQVSAMTALMGGVSGFFSPRLPSPWFQSPGSLAATSYYDTKPLKMTLERLIDFDRINNKQVRLSAGAVNVRTGNFAYFDNTSHKFKSEHILASCALPPGLPAIEIDGEHYWDGGLVSNTPLQWVLEYCPRRDTLAFQVDLWSARGKLPQDMTDVATRQKEILFSSRTRENTDQFKNIQRIRHAAAQMLADLPKEVGKDPLAKTLQGFVDDKIYNIVHLIYRPKIYEHDTKDYEFSRLSMEEHWKAGYDDTTETLRHPEIFERPTNPDGIAIFDFNPKISMKEADKRNRREAK
jgi:NTE family protein